MHTRLAASLALVGLAALTGLGTAVHAQGLNGQSVQVTGNAPDKTTQAEDLGTQTVTPAGAAFTDAVTNVLVSPGQVVFTFNPVTSAPSRLAPAGFSSFDGYQIAEMGASPVAITGVSLDSASSLPGFSASDISFDASDVFANFQGLNFDPSQNVTLDLKFAPAVPEPSARALFAVGSLGLSLLLIRARRKAAAAA